MNAGVHPIGQRHAANTRGGTPPKHAGNYSLQTTNEPKCALLEEVIVNMKAIHPARDGLEEIAASGDRDHLPFNSSVLRLR